jgi:CelD/BcsL family acetyltransferase involved in cellulose biosynthesis
LARECRGIDLSRVREAGDYLTLISANSRNKIRKAIKECELAGPIRLELAKDLPQAESMYADLCRLHNETWEERGKVGAFDNTYLREFHHDLIKNRFKNGEIQMVAMYCGDILLGVLYNFAYRDQVYNYQSGINYKSGIKNCKPGLLIHALTVKHNAQCDYFYYDLLAGDSQYKRTLATSSSSLYWIVYQPDRWKFRAENRLRLFKRYLSRPLRTEKLPD